MDFINNLPFVLKIVIGSLISLSIAAAAKSLWNYFLRKLHGDGMLIQLAAQRYSENIHGGDLKGAQTQKYYEHLEKAFHLGKLKKAWQTGAGMNWVYYKIAVKYLEDIRRGKGLNKEWELKDKP